MKDYSQSGEQRAVLHAFKNTKTLGTHNPTDKQGATVCQWCSKLRAEWVEDERCPGAAPGRLLEIGAWSPVDFSNSRALIEYGWSGILIEPSPGPMCGLLDAYGSDERVTLLQAAVATAPGLLDLHVSDDAISTSSEAEYEKWKNAAKFRGRLLVPVITLEDISNRFGGFDFISIDAEGQSAELFLHVLKLGWEPRCVVVEYDNRLPELMTAASAAHYTATLVNQTNVVLVR